MSGGRSRQQEIGLLFASVFKQTNKGDMKAALFLANKVMSEHAEITDIHCARQKMVFVQQEAAEAKMAFINLRLPSVREKRDAAKKIWEALIRVKKAADIVSSIVKETLPISAEKTHETATNKTRVVFKIVDASSREFAETNIAPRIAAEEAERARADFEQLEQEAKIEQSAFSAAAPTLFAAGAVSRHRKLTTNFLALKARFDRLVQEENLLCIEARKMNAALAEFEKLNSAKADLANLAKTVPELATLFNVYLKQIPDQQIKKDKLQNKLKIILKNRKSIEDSIRYLCFDTLLGKLIEKHMPGVIECRLHLNDQMLMIDCCNLDASWNTRKTKEFFEKIFPNDNDFKSHVKKVYSPTKFDGRHMCIQLSLEALDILKERVLEMNNKELHKNSVVFFSKS